MIISREVLADLPRLRAVKLSDNNAKGAWSSNNTDVYDRKKFLGVLARCLTLEVRETPGQMKETER